MPPPNVRSWHLADMPSALQMSAFRGKADLVLATLMSTLDPKLTFHLLLFENLLGSRIDNACWRCIRIWRSLERGWDANLLRDC